MSYPLNVAAPPSSRGARVRTRTPIVDQHATWIAVNPVQGCPKACAYCFLNERGQAGVRPEQLATPDETVSALLASPLYAPDRPVALYTWTDVMALPASRSHLAQLLEVITNEELPNPIVLITKCHVPDETLAVISAARRRGLKVIMYLSYSGLGRDIERGIRHTAITDNFPRLAADGIPMVHYWRPAFPESATTSTMEHVLDWVAQYARCTVAAGLKVEPSALPRLAGLWPELATTEGVTEAEGVYPRAFWEFIHHTSERRPDYPLFHTNSCALAYILGRPDAFGVHRGTVCRVRNHCPAGQRQLCGEAANSRPPLTRALVRSALAQRDLAEAPFHLDEQERELVISAPVETSRVAALTQDLGIRVRVGRADTDSYWNSGTAGARPLIIG